MKDKEWRAWQKRPDELTDEEHGDLDERVVSFIWEALNDAFGQDPFIESESPSDAADDEAHRTEIAHELIASIGVLLRELGSLAPHYVPKPGDVVTISRIMDVMRRMDIAERSANRHLERDQHYGDDP